LSATIVKHRFQIEDVYAADYASIILFLPVVLYPLVGWFTDRYCRRLSVCNFCILVDLQAVLFCSVATLTCYILLLIPPKVLRTPLFALVCFAFGYGPAPLLLVIIAPFLTEHISTALGLHKSLEMAGSTLMQTVSHSPSYLIIVRGITTRFRGYHSAIGESRDFSRVAYYLDIGDTQPSLRLLEYLVYSTGQKVKLWQCGTCQTARYQRRLQGITQTRAR